MLPGATARRVGIVGGTGFPTLLEGAQLLSIETPHGDVEVAHRREQDVDLFFLRRHGPSDVPFGNVLVDRFVPKRSPQHTAPHRIVHRANVEALARCKVDAVLALNAVGALSEATPPGSLLVPDDWLDLRKTTETFHDARAVHVDVTEPYCPHLRGLLLRASADLGHPAWDGGTYACVEGPRLETPAEVRMLRGLGGTVVGMTGLPEASLARERALCYASVCLVTNPAAGVARTPLSAHDLRAGAEALAPLALDVARRAAHALDPQRTCRCRQALDHARL